RTSDTALCPYTTLFRSYMEQTLRLGVARAAIIPTDWAKLTGTFPQLARTGRTIALAKASAKDTSELARLREELAAMEETKRGPRSEEHTSELQSREHLV